MHKIINLTAIICSLFILLLVSPVSQTYAFTSRTGDTITITADEIIDESIFLAGENIKVEEQIDGDLWGAAETVNLNTQIGKKAQLAAKS